MTAGTFLCVLVTKLSQCGLTEPYHLINQPRQALQALA